MYIPPYKRPPNKFIRFEERRFDDGHGHTGLAKYAHFMDKNNKPQEMMVWIKWDDYVR